MEFEHIPVLLEECMTGLDIKPEGIYADGTAGGGSHSHRIGEHLSKSGMLICADRDEDAINVCRQRLSDLKCGVTLLYTEFCRLPDYFLSNSIKPDGILLDLGVSSYQLDTAERGFSYMLDAELDMRMDRQAELTAKNVVNDYSEKDLVRIFYEYGEERYSSSIAAAIVRERSKTPIETTLQLVEIIRSAMPAKALREKQHPAKRVFQAIRIEVNDELGQISRVLENIVPCMNNGGRICIITFHSLEDRLVKQAFARFEHPCTCPSDFPVCVCGKKPLGRTLKPVSPSLRETAINPRARSAKLRVFVKEDIN